MSQPKLSSSSRALLEHHGYTAALYQPVTLFPKDGRKLPNVAVPTDPWECFLRRPGGFGVVCKGIAATADEAVLVALYVRPGLKPAMLRLTRAVESLTGALRAGQD